MHKHRSWVEIDTQAITDNVALFRSRTNDNTALLGMVKSNAYGHGLTACAQLLCDIGIDWLGVDAIEEAYALRDAGITTPILVVGYTHPIHAPTAAARDITLTVSSCEALEAMADMGGDHPVSVHIELETGLGRQGVSWEHRRRLLVAIAETSQVTVTGIFSHLAAAESPEYRTHTNMQYKRLLEWQAYFQQAGIVPQSMHIAASAAALLYPDFHLDMVRLGISLYGYWASEEVSTISGDPVDALSPALSWKSIISEYKTLPAGTRVGYDLTEAVSRDSVVAIVPIGYWHGYPRHLSSVGEVLVRGKRAKVLGRISMDMIIIDVTDIADVSIGDEVVLIGAQGDEYIPAEEVAEKADTIQYEIITRIQQDIPRYYR